MKVTLFQTVFSQNVIGVYFVSNDFVKPVRTRRNVQLLRNLILQLVKLLIAALLGLAKVGVVIM